MARISSENFVVIENPRRSFTPQVDNPEISTGSETSITRNPDGTMKPNSATSTRVPDDPFSLMYQYTPGHDNKDMRDEEYLMSLEARYQKAFMDYENAYNSPKAQMARYMEAGLNPNMIYSKDNNGASGSAPAHSNPAQQGIANKISSFNTMSAMAKGVNDIRMQNAQISSLEYDNELKKAQAMETRHRAITEIFNAQVRAKEVDETTERIKKLGAETWNEKLRGVLLTADIQNISLEKALKIAGLGNSYLDIAVKSATMLKTLAEKAGIDYETAIKKYTYENILPLQAQAQAIENDKNSWENFLNQTYGQRERETQGHNITNRLFSWITQANSMIKSRKSAQQGSESYLFDTNAVYNEWKKKYLTF